MKYEILMEKCLQSVNSTESLPILYLISNILYLDIIPKHFQKVNCMFSENRDKTKEALMKSARADSRRF